VFELGKALRVGLGGPEDMCSGERRELTPKKGRGEERSVDSEKGGGGSPWADEQKSLEED